jgi:hypothetical protein
MLEREFVIMDSFFRIRYEMWDFRSRFAPADPGKAGLDAHRMRALDATRPRHA